MKRVGSGICAAILLAPFLAHADGPDSYGVGSRNAAMGSAMAGGTSDWSSPYHNPAGLAKHRRLQAGIGLQAAQDQLQPFEDIVLGYDQDGAPIRGDVDANYDDVYGLTAGVAVPLSERLYFGAMVWSPMQRLVRIMTVDPYVPHYVFYVNRAQRITLNMALGYRVTPWLRAGAGASVLAGSNLDIDFNIPAGEGSESNESRGLMSLDITPTLTPVAGLQLEPGYDVVVGVAYRGETDLTTTVRQKTGSNTVINVGPSLRFTSRVRIAGGFIIFDHFTPQQLAAGASWQPDARPFSLYGDLTWMDWSEFGGPYIDPAFEDIFIPPLGTVEVNWRRPPEPEFRDTYVPRIGGEFRIRDRVALRAGYSYEMSPAPIQEGDANILDANAHVASAGLGVKFRDPTGYVNKPVQLNAHVRARMLQTVTATKAVTYDCNDPNDHPPVGYPCSGDVTTAGQILSAGLDLTFDF